MYSSLLKPYFFFLVKINFPGCSFSINVYSSFNLRSSLQFKVFSKFLSISGLTRLAGLWINCDWNLFPRSSATDYHFYRPAAFHMTQEWCLDDLLVVQHPQLSCPGTDVPDDSFRVACFHIICNRFVQG